MGSSVSSTILSCVVSSFLACSLTTLLMQNADLLKDNGCVVPGLTRRTSRPNNFTKQTQNEQMKDKLRRILLKNAAKQGAVCLDGSPPGYMLKREHGSGVKSWIIYFNGGAWCYDEQACYQRSYSKYGSTRHTDVNVPNEGLYSVNKPTNPDFYNWNMAFVFYCDGSSFTGMRTNPVYLKNKAIYFRGKLIMNFVIKDLLNRGVRKAKEVLLVGSSAGSLAVLLHADYIKSRMPSRTKVRAVADSGFFVDLRTYYGAHKFRERFRSVLVTHNSTTGLPQSCLKHKPADKHWKCMFPQYFFKFIQTPVFVLQSAYDVWQIISNLDVVCTIPTYDDLVTFSHMSDSIALLDTRRTKPITTHSRDLSDTSKHRKRRETHDNEQISPKTRKSSERVLKKTLDKWHWQGLYSNPAECTKSEIKRILNIRKDTLKALRPVLRKKGSGLFLSPCIEHTQASYDRIWKNMNIKGKTVRQAISDWYSGKSGNHFHIGDELSFASCVP